MAVPLRLWWCLLEQVHGTARGGDCDELRLLSDETTFINLRAHGGSFSFLGTKVLPAACVLYETINMSKRVQHVLCVITLKMPDNGHFTVNLFHAKADSIPPAAST